MFILKKKGVSLRKSLDEGILKPSINSPIGSLWSMKKVFCALMTLHRLVSRSRNLIGCEVPLKLMNETGNLFTTGAISSSSKGDFKVCWHCFATLEKMAPPAPG
jgi:hypothetical protein